jgi:Fic family protein
VFLELQRQIGNSADLRVVHIAIRDRADRADRAKRSEGLSNSEFDTYDQDETEKQVEETPAFANLDLNGADPRGELARTIIRRLVPDFSAAAPPDDGENVSAIEPLVIGNGLESLARDLIRDAADFAKEVPIGLAQPLANLVRAMNCYYSNLIEGHNAPLADIDLALNGNYEKDPKKRYLQAEAKAHIEVQRWIDEGELDDQAATSARFLNAIHDHFFSEFPDPQWVENRDGSRRVLVVPGGFRQDYTEVGRHEPPSPGAIPRFMTRFDEVYGRLTSPEAIVLATAPAHHRLLWIHPFVDGNGRVARLMSDTMLSRTLRTHSLWSVSRGLANYEAQYKALVAACDQARQGDLDGRGNLSEKALTEFSAFFLNICLEQVRFMRKVMRLDEIGSHIDRWVETASAYGDRTSVQNVSGHRLHPAAARVLKAVLHDGALSLANCRTLVESGVEAAEVIAQLKHQGVVSVRGEVVSFTLPAHRAERFLPGLFP